MGDVVVAVEGLTKRYGRRFVLSDVSFEVKAGEIFGFLGPNGAGKTTTIRLLTALAPPTSGRIQVLSRDVPAHFRDVASRVGAVVERPEFYRHLSARDNLRVLAWTAGLKAPEDRIVEVLGVVGLTSRADQKVRKFSTGMVQRLGLASVLINKPELLILDEPTAGLDPNGVREFRELIKKLADEGHTIFLSSHQLQEVELLCARVALIASGEIVKYGALQQLIPSTQAASLRFTDPDRAHQILEAGGIHAAVEGKGVRVDGIGLDVALRLLAVQGLFPLEVNTHKLTLEDIFVEATAGETGDRR